MSARNLSVFTLILAIQFGIFEAALRTFGSSEAAPSFQGLFESDPVIGHRLKPNARTRFATSEFDVEIVINGAGVRDDDEIGPKARDDRRIVLLGDSIVLSVQVPSHQTFGELLERRLNGRGSPVRYRVINAGVQGYGPVEEMLFFRSIAATLQPDLVLAVVFVGNDAEEAFGSKAKLESRSTTVSESLIARLRRLVRRSMVLQIFRLRVLSATERFRATGAPPEPPLQSYAADPAPRIAEGLAITRRSIEGIVDQATDVGARSAIVLMPARFQVDDADYGRLKATVQQTGGVLIRDGANQRFDEALGPVAVPRFDVLPSLRRALPGPDLFFQDTVHLTPRGHAVVAEAIDRFIQEQHLLPR
jgi:lysophospholipase L1-like esterase